jgi:cytochrome c553
MTILIALAIVLTIVLISSYVPKRSRTHCRCGRKADIIDPEQPWIVWCARCHVQYLLDRGEIL